ncbi:MAG: antitermination protein NusG [Gammaproteobacteria bacterium]|nr:antitermination protein NusG [Gammaproteobacteria bacterium]
MLMKILLTTLVIIGALMVLRMRSKSRHDGTLPATSRATGGGPPNHFPKVAAYGALAIMLLGCSVFVYYQWQATWRVVTVRVVNAGTGSEALYTAYKRDVAVRSFVTTDGRTVNLAEVERMELGR